MNDLSPLIGSIPEVHRERFIAWAKCASPGNTFEMHEDGIIATITWTDDDPLPADFVLAEGDELAFQGCDHKLTGSNAYLDYCTRCGCWYAAFVDDDGHQGWRPFNRERVLV